MISSTDPSSATDLKEAKRSLRRAASERRRAFRYRTAGEDLLHTLLSLQQVREADSVAGYYAIGAEMDLTPVFERLRSLGKRLYLPRVEGRRLRFYDVTSRPPLLLSSRGIPEPTPDLPPMSQCDLFLCPGLLFDYDGGRLGYGGGYYDRFLTRFPDTPRLGVGYSIQWVRETLPREDFDLPMHGFANEREAGWYAFYDSGGRYPERRCGRTNEHTDRGINGHTDG